MSSSTRGTTRKVLGSLAVIGTAAAVAGLGTFGTFTDSTTPVSAQLTSGTVSIDLAQPAAPIPATTAGLLPGDSIARTVTLSNDGNSPLSTVALGVNVLIAAELLPEIEAVMVRRLNEQLAETDRGGISP